MGIIKTIVTFFFCFFVLFVAAQKKYDVEVVNGEKHYVFIVERGNTLYSITKEFDIKEADLKAANPGLSNNLTLGQKILVPVSKSGYKQSAVSFKKHTIEKGETFYGLSRQYDVSIQEIKAANPGLESLQKGEVINIPVKAGESVQKGPVITESNVKEEVKKENLISDNALFSGKGDSIVRHKVLAHETLYSISKRYMVSMDTLKEVNGLKNSKLSTGQEIIIPLKKIKIREVLTKEVPPADTSNFDYGDSELKDKYSVTILLPFFLDQNASHLSKGSLTSPKEILAKTKIALDFYMGVQLALDSLERAGVNLDVQVFDTRGDSATVAKILNENNVAQTDLIIGPFYGNTVSVAARFAKENKIHQVIPFSASGKVLFDNPYVSKMVASNSVLIRGTLEYVKERYEGKRIVLIKSTSSKDDYAYKLTREILAELNIEYIEKPLSTNDMGSYFQKDELNVVLAPSSNQIFATNLFVGLNKTLNKFGYRDSTVIHVFGTDNWERFEGIKMKYKTRMNYHYASPIYADWNNEKTQNLIQNFRNKFDSDPSDYSLHGFDITMYYISGLKLFGTGFYQFFNQIKTDPIVNRIEINQLGSTNGYENQSYFILRYLPSYQKILTK